MDILKLRNLNTNLKELTNILKKILLTILASLFLIGSAKTQIHPITIHSNQRVVSLQMTSSEYYYWKLNDEFSIDAKRNALIQDIFRKFDDKFDFIFLILNETTIPSNFPYHGMNHGTANAISGIGIPIFNDDASFCSAGKLKGVIALARKDYLKYGPSLHEIMHNWGNRIINTMDWDGTSEVNGMPHWGFTGGSTAGQLGGFMQSTLQTNVGGNPYKYRASLFGGYTNGGNSIPYNDLELYLMGMIPLTDVANFDVFSGITQKATIGTNITEFTASKRENYDNARILAAAGGPRNPSYENAQKNFRILIVMLTPSPLTQDEWTSLDAHSEWFSRTSNDGDNGIYNFWEATKGLGTVETGNLLNAVRTSQINPPTIIASGPTTFCNGKTVSLSTTSTDPLQWYKDGILISGATSQTYIASQSGNYSLKAGIGDCSVTSLSSVKVTVTSDLPIPSITASGPTTFCVGGSVTLTASSSGSYSYLWSNGLTTKSILVNSTGSYSVKFTGNDGCASYSSNPVQVLSGNLGNWSQKTSFGGTGRRDAVGFSIGSKVYILTGYDGANKKDFWEYNTITEKWTQKTSFGGTARFDAIGFSIGNKGYVGLGWDGSYKKDLWEYDPNNDTWTQKADFGGIARYAAVGFSIGNKGYVGTGNSGSLQRDFWEYDPFTNIWTQKASFGGTARHSAVGFSIGLKGYIGTGIDGGYTNDFWEYNPDNDTWTQKSDYGGDGRYAAVGFSMGTKGYIGAGSDGSNKSDFWEYDQFSNKWVQVLNFGGTARYGAIGVSAESAGYIGTGSSGSYKNDFWEYKIKTPTITANGPTTFCKGGSVTLTSSPATSYLWSNNATTQSITVSTSGDYSVTTNDGSECLVTSSIMNILVNDLPTNAGNIIGSATVCQGQNSVSYLVPAIANAATYIWTLPNGVTGNSSTNTIELNYSASAVSGNITVKGVNSCGNGTISTFPVIVKTKPPTPIISLTGNVLYSNALSGNQWYNQSGLINGAVDKDYMVSLKGDYYVMVTLSNCSSDPSNTISFVPTGIENIDKNRIIEVYPNPISNELNIEVQGNNENLAFEILNSIGQVVYKGNIMKKNTLQTKNFAPGVYLVKLTNGQTFEFKKIIKE